MLKLHCHHCHRTKPVVLFTSAQQGARYPVWRQCKNDYKRIWESRPGLPRGWAWRNGGRLCFAGSGIPFPQEVRA
jgi:hypothetical protein